MSTNIYRGHYLFLPCLINRAATPLNCQLTEFLDQRGLTLTHWRVLVFLAQQGDLGITLPRRYLVEGGNDACCR